MWGKRTLLVDENEIISVRTFLGTNFRYTFELDNLLLEIRRDEEDYDIFESGRVNDKFKNIRDFGVKPV